MGLSPSAARLTQKAAPTGLLLPRRERLVQWPDSCPCRPAARSGRMPSRSLPSDVGCHWLRQCFWQWKGTGRASGTQRRSWTLAMLLDNSLAKPPPQAFLRCVCVRRPSVGEIKGRRGPPRTGKTRPLLTNTARGIAGENNVANAFAVNRLCRAELVVFSRVKQPAPAGLSGLSAVEKRPPDRFYSPEWV